MTDRLAASTAKLQAEARKAPLLQKLQQSPVPEMERMKPSSSATDTKTKPNAIMILHGICKRVTGSTPVARRNHENSANLATAWDRPWLWDNSNNTMLTFSSRLFAAPVFLLERQL
uniref:Uncharacterized protein n=1 Tax=Peronospora matthiolae TaxID=2874970 RepID=A0AAV1UCS6_9STRA